MGTAPTIQPLVGSRYAPSRLPNTEAELPGTEPRLQNPRPTLNRTPERSRPTHSDAHSREVDSVATASTAAATTDNSFAQPVIEGDMQGSPPPVKVLLQADATHAELSKNEMPAATRPAADLADHQELTLDDPMTTAPQTASDLPSTSRPAITSFEAQALPSAEASKNLLETNVESMRERPVLSGYDDERWRRVRTDLEPEPRFQDDEVGTLIPELEPGGLTRAPSNQLNHSANHDGSLPVSFTSPAAESSSDWIDQEVERNSPVIRVTIGRIEVRAVSPAPEATLPSSVPAPPKLSLDDFLRQHNGRRQ